jgi:hypothetical protein
MTMFEERERAEEAKFRHEQELIFKIRNRRNKLFGLWIAEEHLGLSGPAAANYAKDIVMADFEAPGPNDMMSKVTRDLAGAGKVAADLPLQRRLRELEAEAKAEVMRE